MGQPADKLLSVLFTSVGRRVELLRAFRRAFDSLGLTGQIVALDVDPLAPALQVADRPYIVPRLDSTDYVPALTDICCREQVRLIFPLIDPDVPVLAGSREAIEGTGARLAVVSSAAAAICADKWATVQFFQRLGLNAPRSWLPDQMEPDRVEFPLFVKPREGSAARSALIVRDARELAFFSQYVDNCIVQEYLPGPEITTDVVCDVSGDLLAIVSRRRIEVRWGEVAKGVTVHDAAVTEACVKIAAELPATGPITVQCIMKSGIPYFTEINARLGGGIPLGIAAGVDSPLLLLARAADVPVDMPRLGCYQTGLYLTRFDESFFVNEQELEQMAVRRL